MHIDEAFYSRQGEIRKLYKSYLSLPKGKGKQQAGEALLDLMSGQTGLLLKLVGGIGRVRPDKNSDPVVEAYEALRGDIASIKRVIKIKARLGR